MAPVSRAAFYANYSCDPPQPAGSTDAQDWDDTKHVKGNWDWCNSWQQPGGKKKETNLYPDLKEDPFLKAKKRAKVKKANSERQKPELGGHTAASQGQTPAIANQQIFTASSTHSVTAYEATGWAATIPAPLSLRSKGYRTGEGPVEHAFSSGDDSSNEGATTNSELSTPATSIAGSPPTQQLVDSSNGGFAPPDPEPYDWEKHRECDQAASLETFATNLIEPQFTTRPVLIKSAEVASPFHAILDQCISEGADILRTVLNAACVDWHKPIRVNPQFRIKSDLPTSPGDEPTFDLLDVCKALRDEKKVACQRWLGQNVFIIDIQDLTERDLATRRWPTQKCHHTEDKVCEHETCNFAITERRAFCMRKPKKFVTRLFLADVLGQFSAPLVARTIKPFQNLTVLGLDLRGLSARDKEDERRCYEFDAPQYLITSLTAVYKHYGSSMPEGLRVRVIAEDAERAELYMQAEGFVSIIARRWNREVVPMTEEEEYEEETKTTGWFPDNTPASAPNPNIHLVGSDGTLFDV